VEALRWHHGDLSERQHQIHGRHQRRQPRHSVVTATVSDTSFFADVPSLRLTMTGAHALGVRVNCIVEVKVGVLGGAQGPSGARRNATDVANAILDRISAAS
jgi:PknH-like extracellular domain